MNVIHFCFVVCVGLLFVCCVLVILSFRLCIEELTIKHWIETNEIIYYKRYVDNIIIIFNQHKTTEDSFTKYMKNINKRFEFKRTEEENKSINCLDLIIQRNNNIQLGIYRNPTQSDTAVHFTSNHPLLQNLAAYIFYINRLISTPITDQARQREMEYHMHHSKE